MKLQRFASIILCLFLIQLSSTAQTRRTTSPFDSAPFNTSVEKLPPHYIGHSLVTLAQILSKWTKVARKSEFETTADYQARLSREKQKPLVGDIHFDSLIAFTIAGNDNGQLTASYDADLGIMTVTLKLQRDYSSGGIDNPIYRGVWAEASRELGTYVGRNAFNRAVRVKVYRDDNFFVGVSASDLEPFAELRNGDRTIGGTKFYGLEKACNVSLHMGAMEARAAKPNLRALVIGQLADNPFYYNYDRDTPTISDPYDSYNHTYLIKIVPKEIWIYDISSGLVYARITPSPDNPDQPSIAQKPSDRSPSQVPISGGVLNSEALNLPRPPYPAIAKAAHATGTVTVQVTIDESGRVISAHAVSGHPLLQQAAVQAAYQAKFPPKKLTGVLTYNFYEGMDSARASDSVDESRIYSPKDVDVKARILSRPEPIYTEEARRNQVSGTVILRAVFSASGQMTNIRVVSGLPNGLTERAIEAARQIRFTPAMKDGRAVSQYIQIEYNFNGY